MKEYEKRIEELFKVVPSFQKVGNPGYHPGLENLLKIESIFGNPHKAFKSIHVAGTNGKGSVSHILASILSSKGYKVGLYTSPHMVDFRERIKVNGEMIPRESVIEFLDKCDPYIEELKPSFFEITTVMAFDYFAKSGVDYAVIECGLGGRLDSTNIITPELSIITSIGMDHTDILGDTIAKIAYEKGGIIKEGVPVVVGDVPLDVKNLYSNIANERHSDIFYSWEHCDNLSSIVNDIYPYMDLKGGYQLKNLITVLVAMRVLGIECDYVVKDAICHAAERTGLHGRWEIFSSEPFIVCDIAHNPHGIEPVMEQLKKVYEAKPSDSKLYLLFGVMGDKDLNSIQRFLPKNGEYLFTQADSPRAMKCEVLQKRMSQMGFNGECIECVKAGIEKILRIATKNDIVYIGGSSYVVAEALEPLFNRFGMKKDENSGKNR